MHETTHSGYLPSFAQSRQHIPHLQPKRCLGRLSCKDFCASSFLIFLCLSAMETLCIQVILYLLLSRSVFPCSSLIYSTPPLTFVTIIFFALPFCDTHFHFVPYCVLNCINHQLLARCYMGRLACGTFPHSDNRSWIRTRAGQSKAWTYKQTTNTWGIL